VKTQQTLPRGELSPLYLEDTSGEEALRWF
jgi:hypothetical protein